MREGEGGVIPTINFNQENLFELKLGDSRLLLELCCNLNAAGLISLQNIQSPPGEDAEPQQAELL